jgi:hypothetical protein
MGVKGERLVVVKGAKPLAIDDFAGFTDKSYGDNLKSPKKYILRRNLT